MTDEAQSETKDGYAVLLQRGAIKPCPKCKEQNELSTMDDNEEAWCVVCWKCSYIGPESKTEFEAIESHNERAL